jgi:hypothetical protein
MAKTLTALFIAVLAALFIAGTSYAESAGPANPVVARLGLEVINASWASLQVGSTGSTVDTILFTTFSPSTIEMVSDPISLITNGNFTTSQSLVLSVVANVGFLTAGGSNTIQISKFSVVSAIGGWVFDHALSTTSYALGTMSTTGPLTDTLFIHYMPDSVIPAGTYTSGTYAISFTLAVI